MVDVLKLRSEPEKKQFFNELKQAKQFWVFLTSKFSKLSANLNQLDQRIEKMRSSKKTFTKKNSINEIFFEINELFQFLQIYCDYYLAKTEGFSILQWLTMSKKELSRHIDDLKEKA